MKCDSHSDKFSCVVRFATCFVLGGNSRLVPQRKGLGNIGDSGVEW